ncbi:MAG TPA: dTMP kinase [Blastocatellia bacterium]|nr:dTMP kinase [Blastocatellia bacterium]
MRGSFITLEGLDGCGKSTQLTLLARALERRGYDCVITREPGGTPLGEKVRELLLSDESVGIAATTELFLMSAARAQHVEQVIKPNRDAGRVVISDRHLDSTVAFQGYGRGLDLRMIDAVNGFATGGLLPDLTIVLDLKPEVARLRLGARPVGGWLGAVDEERAEFHRRVREGYLKLVEASPERVKVVDAGRAPHKTHEQVLSLVLSVL